MSQTIRYINDGSSTHLFLYRGGYDPKTKRGVNPFPRPSEFNGGWTCDMEFGFFIHHLSLDCDLPRAWKFFSINPDAEEDVSEVNLGICFDACARVVLFKEKCLEPDYNLHRITETRKTKSKTVQEWNPVSAVVRKSEYEVMRWSFKSPDDYIIVSANQRNLANLIPEKAELYKGEYFFDYESMRKNLWGMEPFSLNDSWDLDPDQKMTIWKREEERQQRIILEQEQLERQKGMPGYCDICGRPNADWCINPYEYEMYRTKNYMWLCLKCQEEQAADV